MTTKILANALMLHRALRTRGSLSVGEAAALLAGDDPGIVRQRERKAARRALMALRDAGEPLTETGDAPRTRWIYEGATEALKLTQNDLLGLEMGAQLVAFLRGTEADAWLESLRARLRDQVDVSGEVRAARFADRFRVFDEPARSFANREDAFDDVVTAVLSEHQLDLVYEGEQLPGFRALGLVVYRRALYLIGRLPGEQGPCRRLALDRIETVQSSRIRFERPEDFDLDAELAPWFGIRPGPAPERVRMRFSARVARYVEARRWHRSAELAPIEDGGVELRMDCGGEELIRFACEWGDTVEVLEPAWLRHRVHCELRNAFLKYGPDEAPPSTAGDGGGR